MKAARGGARTSIAGQRYAAAACFERSAPCSWQSSVAHQVPYRRSFKGTSERGYLAAQAAELALTGSRRRRFAPPRPLHTRRACGPGGPVPTRYSGHAGDSVPDLPSPSELPGGKLSSPARKRRNRSDDPGLTAGAVRL